MTQEEKADIIQKEDCCVVWNGGCPNVRIGAMKMAKWKDETMQKVLQEAYDTAYERESRLPSEQWRGEQDMVLAIAESLGVKINI